MNRNRRRQRDRKSQGVTLIELLIVLTILVVIAGMALPLVMRMVTRSRLSSTTRELQTELNRTRLESMKSGEPLVFHFQPGTGLYEIMSKQQYDLSYPRRQPVGLAAGFDSFDAVMPQAGMMSDDGLSMQAAGSTAPTLADYGSTSLADSFATQSSTLADRGEAPSLGDLGPPPSLGDLMAEPDMQMIAAMPVSKFVPVQKMLSYDHVFGLRASGFGLQENVVNSMPEAWSLKPEASQWSDPIFFFPNGRTSNAQFSVCTEPAKRYYIDVSVRGLTGTARIGEIEVMP